MSDNILIIGGSGFIGYNLLRNLKNEFERVEFTYFNNKIPYFDGTQLDTSNRDKTIEIIKKINPDMVIQTSALAGVDLAEQNHNLADSITVDGTNNVIEGCKITKSKIIYISTTYVYGKEKKVFSEEDEPKPTSYYGLTKYKAEKLIQKSRLPYLILRTDQPYGWPESWQRQNSASRAISTMKDGKVLKEIVDWYNVFTYILDFVKATKMLIDNNEEGIFNITGPDYLNRYEWALITAEVFGFDRNLIKAINSKELSLPVKRDNSNVSNIKLVKKIGLEMLGVKAGLNDMLKSYKPT